MSVKDTADDCSGASVREQIYFVEPDVVRFLLVITIHLERDINLFLVPLRLGREIYVNWILLISHTHADVVHLISDSLQLPHQMDPGVGGKVIAWN